MASTGIRQVELSDAHLLGGGVEIRQFNPVESVVSAAPPNRYGDANGMVGLISVARRALSILEDPTPELGVRVRFVSGIVPDVSSQKFTHSPDSRLMTIVRQAGGRHPLVLHERQIKSDSFGPNVHAETLRGTRIAAVASKLAANITLFETRCELADPIIRINALEDKVKRLQDTLANAPVPLFSLFGLTIYRSNHS